MTAPCLLAESPVQNWNPIAVGGVCSEIMQLLAKFGGWTDATIFQWHGQKCDKVDIRRTFNIIPCNLLASKPVLTIPNTYSTRTPNRNISHSNRASRWPVLFSLTWVLRSLNKSICPVSETSATIIGGPGGALSNGGEVQQMDGEENVAKSESTWNDGGDFPMWSVVVLSQSLRGIIRDVKTWTEPHKNTWEYRSWNTPPQLKCRPHMASCNQITLSCSQFGQTYRW